MRILKILTLALMGMTATLPAYAWPHWYIGASAGANQIANYDANPFEIEFDYGYSLSARFGAFVTPRLRVEGEFDYLSTSTDEISGVSFDDDVWMYGGSANVIFDFIASPLFVTPFIGAGLGYTKLDTDQLGEDSAVSGKAMAGLSFSLPGRIRVEPAYQLLWLNGEDEDLFVHMLKVSFTLGIN